MAVVKKQMFYQPEANKHFIYEDKNAKAKKEYLYHEL
jgi:hypothetical protein